MSVFVLFTRPDGKAIWINSEQIVYVMESTERPGMTEIGTQKATLTVKEEVAKVLPKIR